MFIKKRFIQKLNHLKKPYCKYPNCIKYIMQNMVTKTANQFYFCMEDLVLLQ